MIKGKKTSIALLIILILGLLTSCIFTKQDGNLSVHVIDVGQGDSILIKTPSGKNVLIDGGEASEGNKVISHLRKNKVKKIDVLIATHPHSDHIGGLIDVVGKYKIGDLYMPNVIHTSRTFEKLLDAIKENNLKITPASADIVIPLGDDVNLYILGPLKDYGNNLNNWSLVAKISHGVNSFLFTGDIEYPVEMDLIDVYPKDFLQSQFLKVAHHGSNSSSNQDFLEAVQAKIAVISNGKDNSYGHPHKEVLDRLKKMNIAIYTTEKQGSIVIKSDGKKIWSHKEPYYH